MAQAKLPLHMRIVDLKTPGKKAPDIVPRGGAAAATLAGKTPARCARLQAAVAVPEAGMLVRSVGKN